MSEFPETIWAFPEIGECVDAEEVTDEIRAFGITEYRRADLPPTLSAAMELPEVRALVEATSALIGVLEIASVLPTAIQKIYTPRMDAPELVQARAALAAIKEPKT